MEKFVCSCHNQEFKTKRQLQLHCYYFKNRENRLVQINKNDKLHREERLERKRTNSKKHRQENPNYYKNYTDLNKEVKKVYDNIYYQKNKEKLNMKNKEYRKNPKARSREKIRQISYDLMRNFGLSLEEYSQLLENQNGVCFICNITPIEEGIRFSVDHDHKTGKIRGLLCTSCNLGLGNFKDSIKNLQNAINYLNKQNSLFTANEYFTTTSENKND